MNKINLLLIDVNSRSRKDRISLSVSVRLSGILNYLRDNENINYVTINENQIPFLKSLNWVDVVYIGNGRYINENIFNLVSQAKNKGIKILCDIDDFTLALPAYTNHTKAQSTDLQTSLFKLVDRITVANLSLQSHIRELGFRSTIIPNSIYCDYFEYFRKNITQNQNKLIFINTDLIKMIKGKDGFLSALNRFMQENPSLEIDYFGDPFPELLSLRNIHFNDRVTYETMMKILLNGKYLFAIVPLGGDEEDEITRSFHSFKNPFKYINYGFTNIPGIYSDSFIYNEVITSGVNGITTQNSFDGWYRSLNIMARDKNLRNLISKNAFSDIKENFNIYNSAATLLNQINGNLT